MVHVDRSTPWARVDLTAAGMVAPRRPRRRAGLPRRPRHPQRRTRPRPRPTPRRHRPRPRPGPVRRPRRTTRDTDPDRTHRPARRPLPAHHRTRRPRARPVPDLLGPRLRPPGLELRTRPRRRVRPRLPGHRRTDLPVQPRAHMRAAPPDQNPRRNTGPGRGIPRPLVCASSQAPPPAQDQRPMDRRPRHRLDLDHHTTRPDRRHPRTRTMDVPPTSRHPLPPPEAHHAPTGTTGPEPTPRPQPRRPPHRHRTQTRLAPRRTRPPTTSTRTHRRQRPATLLAESACTRPLLGSRPRALAGVGSARPGLGGRPFGVAAGGPVTPAGLVLIA